MSELATVKLSVDTAAPEIRRVLRRMVRKLVHDLNRRPYGKGRRALKRAKKGWKF